MFKIIKILSPELRNTLSLNEGGNLKFQDQYATQIPVKIARHNVLPSLLKFLERLNGKFKEMYGGLIWEHLDASTLPNYLNGSSEIILDPTIPLEKIEPHKPEMGDIDLIVNQKIKNKFVEVLETFKGKQVGDLKLIDFKTSKSQSNALFILTRKSKNWNVQIDFEYLDFEDSRPTEFSKFSHSSSLDDIKENIKGVFHKYLIMSILKVLTAKDIVIVTRTSTKEKLIPIKKYIGSKPNTVAFSIDRGVREKFIFFTEKGGIKYYKEKLTSESEYSKNLADIFNICFPNHVYEKYSKKFKSFVGLVDILKTTPIQLREKIRSTFWTKLFGPGNQLLYVNDVQKSDNAKMTAYKYLCNKLKLEA